MTRDEIIRLLDNLKAEVQRRHDEKKLPIVVRNQILAAINEIRDKLLRRIKSS
jgi:hypothetical protein